MQLTDLTLTNFRSYRQLDLTLEPGLTVISGENGQGKSNLLEAVYLLAIGKSYRAVMERDLVSWQAAEAGGYAIVAAALEGANGSFELRVGLDCRDGMSIAKQVRVNGAPKRASDLVGMMGAVLFAAEDIELVFGPPRGRRRYLDVLLAQYRAGTCRRSHAISGCWRSGTPCCAPCGNGGREKKNSRSGTMRW